MGGGVIVRLLPLPIKGGLGGEGPGVRCRMGGGREGGRGGRGGGAGGERRGSRESAARIRGRDRTAGRG